ncbi:uncharacterized protein LOC126898034 [Daktulosphaira vitifoliae]|uniref:uncharacterized protein LOC126898034 n=1 Tax=Daktulosphaira vitifoliae TaxID=58002 RepID=UPI0021AA79D4|nr:uncharacterized protein LOC126898034 [Daktulosphaira vitifoliae]
MRRYSFVGLHFLLLLACAVAQEGNQLSCSDDNTAVTWTCIAVVVLALFVVGMIAWKQRGQNTLFYLPCCWKPEKNLVLETVNDKTEKNKEYNSTEYAINNGNFGEITPVTAQVTIKFEKTLDNQTVSEHRFLDELQSLTARYPGIIVDVVPNDIAKNNNNSVKEGITKYYRNAVSAIREVTRSKNNSVVVMEKTTTKCSNNTAEQTLDEPDGKRETVIQITDDISHTAPQYHSLEYSAAEQPKEDRLGKVMIDGEVQNSVHDQEKLPVDVLRDNEKSDEVPPDVETKQTGKELPKNEMKYNGEVSFINEKINIGEDLAGSKKTHNDEIQIISEKRQPEETLLTSNRKHNFTISINEEKNDFKEVPLNDVNNLQHDEPLVNSENNRREELNGKEKSPPPPPPPRKHSLASESVNRTVALGNRQEIEIEKSPSSDHVKVVDSINENDEFALDNTDNSTVGSSMEDGVSYNINDITDSGILIEDTTIPSSDEDMDNIYPVSPRRPISLNGDIQNDFHDIYDTCEGGNKTIASNNATQTKKQPIETQPITLSNNFKSESKSPVTPDIKEHQSFSKVLHTSENSPSEQQKISASTTKVPRVIQPHKSPIASTSTIQGNLVVSPSKIPVRRSSSGNNGLSVTNTPNMAPPKKWTPPTNSSVSKLININNCEVSKSYRIFQIKIVKTMEDISSEEIVSLESKKCKNSKKGIVYLSTIPKYMNVTKIKELLEEYGNIGRVFLQPATNPKLKKRPAKHFTEGWVEFEKKKVAKQVAELLNGRRIDIRKRSKYFDSVWNLKYLPRFKWVHLNERLAYEKAVRKHRLRAEVSQVKREANHFSSNIIKSEKNRISRCSNLNVQQRQRQPEDIIINSKKNQDSESRIDFLNKLFN